jgi:plastocyanin
MKKNYIVLFLLVIALISFFLFTRMQSSKDTNQTKKVSKQLKPLPKDTTVTLDENGFSPKEVSIGIGTAVRWKNVSGRKQSVNSDDYPTNQLHKELNFGVFANNSSVVYVFTKFGTYGYHNQLHPEQKGKVIVIK